MKIWDGFVRGYHWLQAGLIVGCWWTAEQGEMVWHQWAAMTLLALWISRVLWGLVGSDTAKFSNFVKGPIATLKFASQMLTGKHPVSVGHDPLGAWMILALLTVVGLQMLSGLFATDEIFTEGPLAASVSADVATRLTQFHHFNFNILLALAATHILVVLILQLRGESLISPMVSGKKSFAETPEVDLKMKAPWLAWVVFAVVWGGLYFWFFGGL